MEMKIEFVLRSVVSALKRMHVLGEEAHLMDGAIKAVENVIGAIEKAKEEQQHENHDQQRENV